MRVDLAGDYGLETGTALDNRAQPRWCTIVTTRSGQNSARVMALTDGQRDCLRLVYNHMKSKDIARTLGVSPHTVDMRLRTAMRTLGVASRIEAARLLVQEESGGETGPDQSQALYQPLIYHAPDVAAASDSATMGSPALRGTGDAASPETETPPAGFLESPVVDPIVNGPPRLATASMDGQTLFDANRAGAGSFDPGSSIRPTVHGKETLNGKPWGERNDLTIGARLGWIFGIAVGSALSFGAILGALAALKTLF